MWRKRQMSGQHKVSSIFNRLLLIDAFAAVSIVLAVFVVYGIASGIQISGIRDTVWLLGLTSASPIFALYEASYRLSAIAHIAACVILFIVTILKSHQNLRRIFLALIVLLWLSGGFYFLLSISGGA